MDAATQPMPASPPAIIPHANPASLPKKAARLKQITRERRNVSPKVLNMFVCLIFSSVSPNFFHPNSSESKGGVPQVANHKGRQSGNKHRKIVDLGHVHIQNI